MNNRGSVHPVAHKEVHFHSSAAKCSYIANIALTTGDRTFQRVVFLNGLTISWFLIVLYVLCRTYKYLKENSRFKCRWHQDPLPYFSPIMPNTGLTSQWKRSTKLTAANIPLVQALLKTVEKPGHLHQQLPAGNARKGTDEEMKSTRDKSVSGLCCP